MKLYIMRHGHSPSAQDAGVATDAERPLSEKGRTAAGKTAAEILKRGGKPVRVLHSPLRRAVETAAAATAVLKPAKGSEVYDPLSNIMGAEELFERLRAPLAEAGELLIVGHQPQVGELAALAGGSLYDFKPAGLVVLELEKGAKRAASVWTFQPDAV